jgi:hypothetical protein
MSGSLRPEDLEPEEVSKDVVAHALGYQSAEHWEETERQAKELTDRLQQLEKAHPVWAPDGHGDPLHTAVRYAVAFWKEVYSKACLAQEIPRLMVGEEYIAFFWALHAPQNRFEVWINLGGSTMFTLYRDGEIRAFVSHAHLRFAETTLTEEYFLAPFRRKNSSNP